MDPTQYIGQLYMQLQAEHQAHMRTIAVMNAVVRYAKGDRDDNAIDPQRLVIDVHSGRYNINDPEPEDE